MIDDAAPGILRPDTRIGIAIHLRKALSSPAPVSNLEGDALTKLVNSDGILWRLNEAEQKALFKRLAANIGRTNAKSLLDEIELSDHRWRNPAPVSNKILTGLHEAIEYAKADVGQPAAPVQHLEMRHGSETGEVMPDNASETTGAPDPSPVPHLSVPEADR